MTLANVSTHCPNNPLIVLFHFSLTTPNRPIGVKFVSTVDEWRKAVVGTSSVPDARGADDLGDPILRLTVICCPADLSFGSCSV